MTSRKPYKTFTREFKLEALRLMEQTDKPASEIAAELGIRRNQLYSIKGDATLLLGNVLFLTYAKSSQTRLS